MEETVRQKFKEMVVYLMKADYENDNEVIESYTDSLMEGAKEYAELVKNHGVSHHVIDRKCRNCDEQVPEIYDYTCPHCYCDL